MVIDMEHKIISKSERETVELAENIEAEKFSGMVICLNGDLGSGKTLFTKGFAASLEIDETITSPSYTIIKEYFSGEMPLYHMDVYRLEKSPESVGLTDYFGRDGIVIIEWADMIQEYLPEERLEINEHLVSPTHSPSQCAQSYYETYCHARQLRIHENSVTLNSN